MFYNSYQCFLQALATSYTESKESEALGLFIQATSPEIIATLLMLLDLFDAIRPLVLCLQISQNKICLSYIPAYYDRVIFQIKNLRTKNGKYFTKEKFSRMMDIAKEIIISLPATRNIA